MPTGTLIRVDSQESKISDELDKRSRLMHGGMLIELVRMQQRSTTMTHGMLAHE